MSQTVQKQTDQSSNTDSEKETESLELEDNLNKSWSGLYNRWKEQLERDFEQDPSQKRKLWLHGSIAGVIPILFGLLPFPLNTIIGSSLGFVWLYIINKQNISEMISKTVATILYSSGLLVYTIPFFILTTILFLLSKLKNPFEYLQNTF